MRTDHVALITKRCEWEETRERRRAIERRYRRYTGLLDVVELHIPYTQWDRVVAPMMRRARATSGRRMLVLGGDALNLDMFSTYWMRSAQRSSPEDEARVLHEFLRRARAVYDEVLILTANHDQRFRKIITRLSTDKSVAESLLSFLASVDDILSGGVDGVTVVPHYLVQIGDVVISHLENNRMIAGGICEWVAQYLTPRLVDEWTVCFQCHTHAQSRVSLNRHTIIETGAAIEPLDYWRDGRMRGRQRLSSYGYGTATLRNGRVDVNTATYILLGWEGWI